MRETRRPGNYPCQTSLHTLKFQDILLGGRILVQQCFEFDAVHCQKKREIFIRINITITYILYINLV